MTVNATAEALGSKGRLLNSLKHFRARYAKENQPRLPELRSMDELYDCFYKYARQLRDATPNTTAALEARKSMESELKVIIPLASDFNARLKMASSDGRIRIGRILEAIDIVAPCACYMLNRDDLTSKTFESGTLPRMFVTNRFHQTSLWRGHNINPFNDIIFHGKVTWTGETKAEASVSVRQNDHEFFRSRLVFTSLNGKNTSQKLPINQLDLSNTFEKVMNQKRHQENTAPRSLPNVGTIEFPDLKAGQVTMASTTVETTTVAYPEHENPYGSVFGGFLVRKGLETAELCSKMFSKNAEVRAASLDDAEFLKVVEIGSILRFKSYVCNVDNEQGQFQISSQVEVYNQSTNAFEICDRFLFTFASEKPLDLPQVAPQNVQELVAQWKSKNRKAINFYQ